MIWIFHWNNCDNFNEAKLFKEAKFTKKKVSILEKLDDKQRRFSEDYQIPYSSITPKITNYINIPDFQYPSNPEFEIIYVKKRLILYPFGCSYFEINVTAKAETFPMNLINSLKIDGHSIKGTAIHHKKLGCGKFNGINSSLCTYCTRNETNKVFEIQLNTQDLMFNNTENAKYKSFKNYNWLYQGKTHYISGEKLISNVKKYSIIPIIYALTFTFSIKHHISTYIEKIVSTVPQYPSINYKLPETIRENLLSIIFLRYYWSNKNFILTTEYARLGITPNILNPLIFVYSIYMKEDTWVFNTRVKTLFKSFPMIFYDDLLMIMKKVPGNILFNNDLMLIPLDQNIPTLNETLNLLNNDEIEIVQELIFNFRNTIPQYIGKDPEFIAKSAAMTANRIVKSLGKGSGDKNTKVTKQLIDISQKTQLIFELSNNDKKNFGLRPDWTFYYLNPILPYFRILINI